MGAIVSVGYPGWPTSTPSWDWWPLLGIALGFWFVRWVARRRVGVRTVVASIAVGLVFANVVHSWGVLAGAVIVLALAAASLVIRRRTRPGTVPPV